ncbi:MAG: isoprenyl transferase [Bacteroidota bacterium]
MIDSLDKAKIPKHIAIIMDGNGRWAKKKGAARIFGHNNAIESVRSTVETCAELDVKYLTLYAFSTENWSRPKLEVDALMKLLVRTLRNEIEELNKNNVKLTSIGNTTNLPTACYNELVEAQQATENNKGLNVVLALNYSGRHEITDAVKKIANEVKEGKITTQDISTDLFSNYLYTKDITDPELMIRTSGERRLSNFLLWQLAYTELYVTPVLWPDFRKEHLIEAIKDFQKRERRFGKTSEQLKKELVNG